MSQQATRILRDAFDVRQALSAIGVSQEIITRVALAAGAARSSSIDVDPCGAPGQFSYIYGVRQIRLELLPLGGWRKARFNNVESIVNDDLGVQIVFQNVDVACALQDPKAISGKGAASRQLVAAGTPDMFDALVAPLQSKYGGNPRVWLLCFSARDGLVSAELSCPKCFEGDQFEGFSERIWVLDQSGELSPASRNQSGPDDDFELDVVISRK